MLQHPTERRLENIHHHLIEKPAHVALPSASVIGAYFITKSEFGKRLISPRLVFRTRVEPARAEQFDHGLQPNIDQDQIVGARERSIEVTLALLSFSGRTGIEGNLGKVSEENCTNLLMFDQFWPKWLRRAAEPAC
jgi:hypothetical protein